MSDQARRTFLPGELRRVVIAFFAFLMLMCGYSILRPVRDAMAVETGADRIQWLFTGTFVATLIVVPIFGWAVRRVPRRTLVPAVYGFFVLNLLCFLLPFAAGISVAVAAGFFIWLSVFNLFIISLFWSNNSDVFTPGEAKRLYGYIAAGGSVGALTGPAITAALAERIGTPWLLAISATLITGSTLCCVALRRLTTNTGAQTPQPVGGSILAGIELTLRSPTLRHIALLIIFYTTVSTVLYVEQAAAVRATFGSSEERTSFFATIDLIVNCLALTTQLAGTRSLVSRFGLRFGLSAIPFAVMAGFAATGAWRTVVILGALQILHRAGEFALVRPSREMVYTHVDPESRYKGKNFIDTTVYRGNDAVASWGIAAVRAAGLNAVYLVGVPAALLWGITGYRLGKRHDSPAPSEPVR